MDVGIAATDARIGAPVTVNVNPASLATLTAADTVVTVAGAAVGKGVIAQPPALTAGMVWSVRCSAANQVTIRLYNSSAAAIDEAAANWLFWVIS
jgi:hypothetical protein